MDAVNRLAPDVGMLRACATLGVNRKDARRRHLRAAAICAPPL